MGRVLVWGVDSRGGTLSKAQHAPLGANDCWAQSVRDEIGGKRENKDSKSGPYFLAGQN